MKIVRTLGMLLTEFYHRRLEYAEYADSEGWIPTMVISVVKYPRPYNPFSIRVTLVSEGIREEFMVCKENNGSRYYWFPSYSRENYGYYRNWEEALNGLELFLMEYIDTARVWDTVVEF